MPLFSEYQLVRLRSDRPDDNLKSGALGVVVMIHPSDPQAYEIEFISKDSWIIALLAIQEEDLTSAESAA